LSRCRVVCPLEAGIGAAPASRAKAASERTRPWCDQATISCAGDDRADAWLVEQSRRERVDVGEDLGLELGRLRGRCLHTPGQRAQHERAGELVWCARVGAAEPAAAFDQPLLGQGAELTAELFRRGHDHAAQLHERLPADVDRASPGKQ
jgi:hypothetical protein